MARASSSERAMMTLDSVVLPSSSRIMCFSALPYPIWVSFAAFSLDMPASVSSICSNIGL